MSQFKKSVSGSPKLVLQLEAPYATFLIVVGLLLLFFGQWKSWAIGYPLLAILWSILAYANRYDHVFFKVLWRHLNKPNHYVAHAKPQPQSRSIIVELWRRYYG